MKPVTVSTGSGEKQLTVNIVGTHMMLKSSKPINTRQKSHDVLSSIVFALYKHTNTKEYATDRVHNSYESEKKNKPNQTTTTHESTIHLQNVLSSPINPWQIAAAKNHVCLSIKNVKRCDVVFLQLSETSKVVCVKVK